MALLQPKQGTLVAPRIKMISHRHQAADAMTAPSSSLEASKTASTTLRAAKRGCMSSWHASSCPWIKWPHRIASQAATNEMLSQLKSAVEMLSSAAISVSVSASDVRHDTDADTNVSADGNASQQPASVSPALQQGTAVPSNTDFTVSRDEKNASNLASVSASDVSNDVDYDVSADDDAFVSPALK